MTLKKEKENHKFTFISEEIKTETLFVTLRNLLFSVQKHLSYYTSDYTILYKQLAGFQTVHIFSKRYIQTEINPFPAMFHLNKPGSWLLLAKCLKKHLWRVTF